jgi:(p)ppGpp synthase/HD superfamily hydrolase
MPEQKEEFYCDLIRGECGPDVLNLVLELTNPTERREWKHRPRAERKAREWEHLATVSDRAKRIKLADRWDNLDGMKHAPAHLMQKYVPESRHLLSMCRHTDEAMASELEERIEELAAMIA